jgi:hypothetical protein
LRLYNIIKKRKRRGISSIEPLKARLLEFGAAFAAEVCACGVFRSAFRANYQAEGRSAVVAEFARAGWFSAYWADGLSLSYFTCVNLRSLGFLFYVCDHFFSSGSGDFGAFPRRIFNA